MEPLQPPHIIQMRLGIIADDLTGAAELAGVAWRYGLEAEIDTAAGEQEPDGHHRDRGGTALCGERSGAGISLRPNSVKLPDVVVIDTDSRLASEAEAARRVALAGAALKCGDAGWIYKKVDSVLRGNVLAEVQAAMSAHSLSRVLLVPANPGLGRTICAGMYFVHNTPIHRTDFLNDPHHPRKSPLVLEMLGAGAQDPVHVRRVGYGISEEGVTIGEAQSREDLATWAKCVDRSVLAAGGAEFFTAVLESRGYEPDPGARAPHGSAAGRMLLISGSCCLRATTFLEHCRGVGYPVLSMPRDLEQGAIDLRPAISRWAEAAIAQFSYSSKVVLAIDRPLTREMNLAGGWGDCLVRAAELIIKAVPLDHLGVEGGATAAKLVSTMQWRRLRVVRELSPGVVTVRPEAAALEVTMKPGSYSWPEYFVQV